MYLSSIFYCEWNKYLQIAGAQYSMSGAEWYHISTSAKDLIRKLMKLHPHERLSIKEAMQHPWVNNITSSDFSNSMGSFSDKFISKLGAEKKVSVQSTKNGKNSVRRSSSVARIKSTTLCSSKFSKKASIQGSCNTGASSRMMNEFIKSVRSTATAALNCQSQSDGLSMPPPPPLTRLGTGAAKRKRSVVASTAAVGQGVEYATSFYDYYKPAKKRVIDAVNVDTCVAGDHYSPSKRVAPAKDVDTYVVGDHSPNMSSLGCTKPSIGSMFNSASKCHSVKAIEASLLKSATVQSLVSESLNSPAGSTNSSLGQAVFITPSAVANGSGNQGGQYSGALLSPIQSLSVLKKKKGGKKTPIQNHSSQSTPNSLSQVSNCDPIVLTDTCSPCTAMCKTLGVVDSEALNAQLGAEQGVRETGVNDVEIEVVALNTSTPQGNAVDILPSVPGKSTISRKFTQKTLEGFKPLFTTSKDSNTRVVPVFGSAAFGGKVRSKKSTILDMLQPNPSIPLPHHRGK